MYDNEYGSGDTSWMLDNNNDAVETPEASSKVPRASDSAPRATKSLTGLSSSQDNPFGNDVDPFSGPESEQGTLDSEEAGAQATSSWGDAAGSFSYGANDHNPDWMNKSRRQQPKKVQRPTLEFGSDDFIESDIQFDGEPNSAHAKPDDLSSALLSRHDGAHASSHPDSTPRKSFKDYAGNCTSSQTLLQVLLFFTFTLSLGTLVISLVHAFSSVTNLAKRNGAAPKHFRNSSLISTASGPESPCPNTCLTPEALRQSKTCGYQFQYVDPQTKKRVCGSLDCWSAGTGGVPSPFKYPLSFSCPDVSSGSAFFCPWDHHLTTWRTASSAGGSLAALFYLYLLRSCSSCVGCTLWLVNLFCFAHAILSFVCMVQDSDAVRQASTFCGDGAVKCYTGRKEQEPQCKMVQFIVVCLLDAGLGIMWCISGYVMCKSRSAR